MRRKFLRILIGTAQEVPCAGSMSIDKRGITYSIGVKLFKVLRTPVPSENLIRWIRSGKGNRIMIETDGDLLQTLIVAQSTVSKYMLRRRRPPSQGWRTFLRNHADAIASVDFLIVPTLAFERLFVLIILGLGRRRLLWIGVTTNPTAEWLARQIPEAFPWDTVPGFLIRDNDGAYGEAFTRQLRAMGISDRLHRAPITLAEWIHRTFDRVDPPRMPRPCDHPG